MRLVCGSVVVRPWQVGDRASLVRHANNRRIWRNLKDRFPHPYTDEDAGAWNPASMRVLEKCGYVREGVLHRSVYQDGEVIDSVLYAKVAA